MNYAVALRVHAGMIVGMKRVWLFLLICGTHAGASSWLPFQKSAENEATPSDRRLLQTVFEPYDVRMPDRLFTSEVRRIVEEEHNGTREKTQLVSIPHHTPSPQAERWPLIPHRQWRDVISVRAPLTVTECNGPCPFCGKPLGRVRCDIAKTPQQGSTPCCGAIIYARETDMPEDYAARPNHTLAVPHLDGKVVTYRFYAPSGAGTPTNTWFSSQGELAWSRLNTVIDTVIPDLAHAVYHTGDPTAAKALAIIYARLADVYSALPFTDINQPFAVARAGEFDPGTGSDAPLTASVWEDVSEHLGQTPCRFSEWTSRYARLPSAREDADGGSLGSLGILAEGFEIARTNAAFRKTSREIQGDPLTFEKGIRARLFQEACVTYRHGQPTQSDALAAWIGNSMKVAIAAQDRVYLEKVAEVLADTYYNCFQPDGTAIEGSFAASAALGRIVRNGWVAQELLGSDPLEGRIFGNQIRSLGACPIVTQLNIESLHGEQPTLAFGSAGRSPLVRSKGNPQRSQSFPFGGLTCLRAGRPGNRVEAILDYQNVMAHAHAGRMNLQLFYNGINLLPDIGNGVSGNLPRELEAHCTGAINGTQLDRWALSMHRYHGGHAPGMPAAMAQFVEVEGRHTFDHVAHLTKVNTFNRQLLTLQLPGGRPCVLDVFRMDGGQRHDLFWHVPSATSTNSLGVPLPQSTNTLHGWYSENATPKPGWLKETEFLFTHYRNVLKHPYREGLRLFTEPVMWIPGTNIWNSTWKIGPSHYAPAGDANAEHSEAWHKHLAPVMLRMWGHTSGDPTQRDAVLGARMPWLSDTNDTLDVRVIHRQGDGDGLRSTFTHFLEPYTPEDGQPLRSVDRVKPDSQPTGGSEGWQLLCESGHPVYVGTALDKGTFSSPRFAFAGRMAVISPRTDDMVLFDGTRARAEDLDVTLETSYRMVLKEVVGDLSGQPDQSVLLVGGEHRLPLGKRLAGQTIIVRHGTSDAHVSAFEIARISGWKNGLFRIDLRHCPPLIHNKLHVTGYASEHPRRVTCDMRLLDGVARPTGVGRRVRFPRSGFETSIAGMSAWGLSGSWSRTIHLKDTPGPEDILHGDPMIIFTLQEGDKVIIPSMFACTAREAGDERIMTLSSTGEATVRFPSSGEVRTLSGTVAISQSGSTTTLTVPAGKHRVALSDGTGSTPNNSHQEVTEHGERP